MNDTSVKQLYRRILLDQKILKDAGRESRVEQRTLHEFHHARSKGIMTKDAIDPPERAGLTVMFP